MDMTIFIITALIIFLLFAFGVLVFVNFSKSKKQERVMSVIRGQSVSSDKSSDADAQNKRRADIARKLKESGDGDEGGRRKRNAIAILLEQAGLNTTVKQYWIYSFVFAVFVVVMAVVFGTSPVTTLLIGVIALLGIPRLFLKRKIKKRQKLFLKEFADALEAMVRLLKAGMPVSEAIKMAAAEYEGPVGEEMTQVYEAQKVGIPLPEAALEAARRMPITEMQMFATGLAIQSQTGASLSEVLLNLAGVIRARYRLRRKVQAMSQEAKSSAAIIGVLPFLIGGAIYTLNPEYIGVLFTDPTGKLLLVGGLCWMGLGIFVMKIMINFKI